MSVVVRSGAAGRPGIRGYTLIEMAIVFVVAGLFVASFAQFYNIYIKGQGVKKTEEAQRIVKDGIRNFLVQNGRYPCPARLDAEREDPDYGMEGVCDSADAAYPALAPGECGGGICIEESANANPAFDSRVRRGAIPFRSINVGERYSIDGYGMRLQYAVTEDLAVASTYDKNAGAIDIQDENDESVVSPVGSSHYVVFSTGPDRIGGYSRYGKMVSNCNDGGLSAENCNTSNSNKKAVYRAASRSTATGSEFDDSIQFSSSAEVPLWKVVDEDGLHMNDMLDGADDRLSIGASGTVRPDLKVAVTGNAKSANLMTDQLGQINGDDLFKSEVISGEDPDFQCAANEYAVAIGRRDGDDKPGLTCKPIAAIEVACGDKQILRGINPDGTLDCAAYVGCQSQTIKGCWDFNEEGYQFFTIAPGGVGSTYSGYTYTQKGANYKPFYYCGEDGNWKLDTAKTVGSCQTCEPLEEEAKTYSCETAKDRKDGFWTGNVTYQRKVTCPGPKETITTVGQTWAQACDCRPGMQEKWESCGPDYPAGWRKRWTRNWVCDTPKSGHWEPWVMPSPQCQAPAGCTDGTEIKYHNCPEGYVGQWQQNRNRDCAAGTVSEWLPKTYPPAACKCVGNLKIRKRSCDQAGQVGEIVETASLNCSTGQYDPWVLESNSCATPVLKWQPGGVPKNSKNPGGNRALMPCGSQGATAACYVTVGYESYMNYPTCTCQ